MTDRWINKHIRRLKRKEAAIVLAVCFLCGAVLYGLGGFVATMAGFGFRHELLQTDFLPAIREALAMWTLTGDVLGLLIGIRSLRLYVHFSTSNFLLLYAPLLLRASRFLAGGAIGLLVYGSPKLDGAFSGHSTLANAWLCGAVGFLATVLTSAIGQWVPGKATAWEGRHVKRMIEEAIEREKR